MVEAEPEILARELVENPRLPVALTLVAGGKGLDRKVRDPQVRRPGLAIAGFLRNFEAKSVEVFGRTERMYLDSLPEDSRRENFRNFLAAGPPALVFSRGEAVPDWVREEAEAAGVPLFLSEAPTRELIHLLSLYLARALAPHTSLHAVLVDCYGVGVLILGESGVGKSETALELLHRGHRLVADDVVEIRRLWNDVLFGTSPELLRHHMEIRGLGILDVKGLFGVQAIVEETSIDLVVRMEPWDENKAYDRLGLEERTTEILGLRVPTVLIPVRPGRNLAILLEVAAMNHRMRSLGYDVAHDFTRRLDRWIEEGRR